LDYDCSERRALFLAGKKIKRRDPKERIRVWNITAFNTAPSIPLDIDISTARAIRICRRLIRSGSREEAAKYHSMRKSCRGWSNLQGGFCRRVGDTYVIRTWQFRAPLLSENEQEKNQKK